MDEKAIITSFEKKYLMLPSPLQSFEEELFLSKNIKVYLKRDDLIHPIISGNKWRKIKGNLLHFLGGGYEKIVTFGGAYSNHIYAVAAVCGYLGIKCEAFIRGDELTELSSPTLKFAADAGMKLHFVSRTTYRELRDTGASHPLLASQVGAFVLPEGGTSPWALSGFSDFYNEILTQLGAVPDYIIVPLGSGGTLAGLVSQCPSHATIIGICVLKGAYYLLEEVNKLLKNSNLPKASFDIQWDFHQGGYGKSTTALTEFIHEFNSKHLNLTIEPMYSAKMMFAFYEHLIQKIPNGSSVLLVHTGGLRQAY